jgi:hypothetical protein
VAPIGRQKFLTKYQSGLTLTGNCICALFLSPELSTEDKKQTWTSLTNIRTVQCFPVTTQEQPPKLFIPIEMFNALWYETHNQCVVSPWALDPSNPVSHSATETLPHITNEILDKQSVGDDVTTMYKHWFHYVKQFMNVENIPHESGDKIPKDNPLFCFPWKMRVPLSIEFDKTMWNKLPDISPSCKWTESNTNSSFNVFQFNILHIGLFFGKQSRDTGPWHVGSRARNPGLSTPSKYQKQKRRV